MCILRMTLYLPYLFISFILITGQRIQLFFLLCLSLDAYESAKLLCEQYYLGAPELELREINGKTRTHSQFQSLVNIYVCVSVY